MQTSKNLIIVPFDFTPKAYHALEHGAFLAKVMDKQLLILHVATREKDISATEKKLHFIVEECNEKYQVTPEILVRKGTRPYSTVKNVAEELNPLLVILKHSGVEGIKHYTGIRTIKILSDTLISFVVIQDAPKTDTLKNIVFPINFLQQHDDKLRRVVFFSQYYPDATMHIITPSGKDTEKEKLLAANFKVMTKAMEDQKIKVNFITHDKKKNKAEDIIELAKAVDADMVMIPTEKVSIFSKFLFGLREEKLISNDAKIPVLCVHSESSVL
ncbi:MAG: universal stress protein [Bacteroidales bacterium]|jgi:nucleotide-binding universal stress UspA family protein|nr:universal stress protein [Bacteroidales bacterium]